MFGVTQTKEITVADQLSAVHRRGREVKPLQKRYGNLDSPAGKTVDKLTLCAVREVAYIIFDLAGLKVNQIAAQVYSRRIVAQGSKP